VGPSALQRLAVCETPQHMTHQQSKNSAYPPPVPWQGRPGTYGVGRETSATAP